MWFKGTVCFQGPYVIITDHFIILDVHRSFRELSELSTFYLFRMKFFQIKEPFQYRKVTRTVMVSMMCKSNQ